MRGEWFYGFHEHSPYLRDDRRMNAWLGDAADLTAKATCPRCKETGHVIPAIMYRQPRREYEAYAICRACGYEGLRRRGRSMQEAVLRARRLFEHMNGEWRREDME